MLVSGHRCFFGQAQRQIQHRGDTGVGDRVEDPVAVAAGGHDAAVGEPLQLVRHRLRPHRDLVGQLTHRYLATAVQRVQQPQPGVVAQHLEQHHQVGGLTAADQRAFGQRRLARPDVGDSSGAQHAASTSLITPLLHEPV